jgi:GAF domain-containing protein/HAMP domain-containing protein/anti-sigma regulatory factor (Ser/Thr protein kinase)
MSYLLSLLRSSLKLRLVSYFLFLSLTTTSLVSLLAYFQARQALQNALSDRLETVAIIKEEDLLRWADEQRELLLLVVQAPDFRRHSLSLLELYQFGVPATDIRYQIVYNSLRDYLAVVNAYQSSFGELLVISAGGDGKVVASTRLASEADYLHDATYVLNAREDTYVHPFHLLTADSVEPTQTIATPLHDDKGELRGIVAAHLDLARVDRVISEHTGIGGSARVYLVDKNNALVRGQQLGWDAVERGVHSEGIRQALAKQNGVGLYDDYRGVPVIGAFRWLAEFELALVVELDQAEAFAPVTRVASITLLIGVASALVLTAGSWLLVSQITRPITQLTDTAVQISTGDLTPTAAVSSSDEVGLLATAFNEMTRQLNLLYAGLQAKLRELQTAEMVLQQYTGRLEAQHEIDRAILAARSPEEIADAALSSLRRLIDCQWASVTMFDYEAQEFTVLAIDSDQPMRVQPGYRAPLTRFSTLSQWHQGIVQTGSLVDGNGSSGLADFSLLQQDDVQAFINVPLEADQEIIGSLNLGADRPQIFSEDHLIIAREVADQISIAIRQAQLLSATQRQLQELTVLHAVATAGAELLSEEALIERVTAVIGTTLNPDSYGILLYDETRNGLRVAPSYQGIHHQLQEIVIPLSRGISGHVARTGEPMRVSNVLQESHYLIANPAIRSELCVPVRTEDELIGVINVESVVKDAFTPADERLLVTLAGQLATAVQRVRLFARTQQEIRERRRVEQALRQARDELELRVSERTAELTLLNRASQTLISTLDQDEVLVTLLDELRNMLRVLACSVWLASSDGREIVCRHSSGPQSERVRGWRLPAKTGIVGWVVHHGRSLIVADAQEDARHDPTLSAHVQLLTRALITVPLMVKGKVIGALQAMDTQPDRFNRSDLAVMESLAATAAFAIENARLFNQARHDAEVKSILLREVNHRVKNNLTAIIGLLYAERRHAGMKEQPTFQAIMQDLISRVQGLATVHTLLSASEWAPISLTELTSQIIHSSLRALPSTKHVNVRVSPSEAHIAPDRAASVALILNELATNSLKYAIIDRLVGHIDVRIYADLGETTLIFADDGPGFPADVLQATSPRYNVGFHLITSIIEKGLGGTVTLANGRSDYGDEEGTLSGAVVTIRLQHGVGGPADGQ